MIPGEDGKLTVSYIQPEFKDALEYLNKLCSEGLLDPLTFTQKQTEFKQVIENEEIQILGSMCAGSMSVYQVESVRKQDMTHMAPPDRSRWRVLHLLPQHLHPRSLRLHHQGLLRSCGCLRHV